MTRLIIAKTIVIIIIVVIIDQLTFIEHCCVTDTIFCAFHLILSNEMDTVTLILPMRKLRQRKAGSWLKVTRL